MPALYIGKTDFCHVLPLSVTLTLAGGFEVGKKQNILALLSHAVSSEQDEIFCCDEAI